jgi:hypothetical protein
MMIMPGLLLVLMFGFYSRYFDWENGVPWLIFTGAMIVVAAISSIMSPWDELRSFWFALSCLTPFGFLAFSFKSNEAFMGRYVEITAIFMCGWVVYQTISAGEIGPYKLAIDSAFGRAEMGMLWPALLAASTQRKGLIKMWLLVLVAVTMLSVFLIFSRILLASTLIAFALLLLHRNKILFLIVAAFILAALIFLPDEVMRDQIAWYRFVDWEVQDSRSEIRWLAWSVIKNHLWWGVGPANGLYFLYGQTRYYGAHNTILTAFLEYGIVGFALIAFFHCYAAFMSVRLWLHGGLGPYYAVAIGSLIACSFVEDWTHKPGQTMLLAVIMVYGRSILQSASGDPYRDNRSSVGGPALEQIDTSAKL